jgi:hypothetical protein
MVVTIVCRFVAHRRDSALPPGNGTTRALGNGFVWQ